MKTLQLLPPQPIQEVVKKLSEHYETYYVGGCIRDFLLGKEVHDYDAATAASVEEMKEILSEYKIIETGVRHGTLTIINQHHHIEITTFRIEKDYIHHRTPKSVVFTRSLREDLKRRDFTINAFACDPDGNFIDEHHGLDDLNHKIIRCIGDPQKRFHEDALRILRAIRFAYSLGFTIEKETEKALFRSLPELESISIERKVDELKKMLMIKDKNPYSILVYYHLFPYFDIKAHSSIASVLEKAPHDLECKIACFFFSGSYARKTLKKWHCSKKMIRQVEKLVEYKKIFLSNDPVTLRHLIYENGIELSEKILCFKQIDLTLFHQMIEEHDYLDKLAINGNDLITLGLEGKQIKEALHRCVELVLANPSLNQKEYLLSYIKSLMKK